MARRVDLGVRSQCPACGDDEARLGLKNPWPCADAWGPEASRSDDRSQSDAIEERSWGETTAIAVAAVFGFGLSSCGFADTSSAPASDPFQAALYNAMNYDRLSVGLPMLTRSPKLENTAGTWAWQMMSVNSLYHQNLERCSSPRPTTRSTTRSGRTSSSAPAP